jgi:hypothetical protein
VYDFFQENGEFYLAMELIPGTDLASHVDRHGLLPVVAACDHAIQACRGLQHAHGRGVVHRDIKPRNLVISPDSHVRIIDFGLARHHWEPTITESGKIFGTLDYIAPEQADDAHTVDGRADIYSLGCTLYFLLAGHPPFAHVAQPHKKVIAHRTLQPRKIEEIRPDVPRKLAEVLRRMMAPSADHRYERAADVAEDLLQATAALRSSPLHVDVSVPGAWFARPDNEPDAEWTKVVATPATVIIRPDEVYRLAVGSDATAAQLAGLSRLRGCSAVQSISLTMCTRLSDALLAHIGGLSGLRSLRLNYCEQLSDEGLAHLRGLTALEYLDLNLCHKVTSAGLAHLRGLTALETLDLGGCTHVDKTALCHLRGFAALESLNLIDCEHVTDEVLECLQGLGCLAYLYMGRCRKITDAGLAYLHQLTALRYVYLAGCPQLTVAALERLEKALPLCEIDRG